MDNLKNHKKSYIVAAVILIAVVLGGLAYSGFDFSKLTGAMISARPSIQPPLSASTKTTPPSNILIAGASEQLVSKYSFKASQEDMMIQKLTVINDLSGLFDSPIGTNAIAQVNLSYTDINNTKQIMSGPFASNGTATFSNLNFFIPKNISTEIVISADINSMSAVGESLSGNTFRLGIKDSQNTAATFQAVGMASANVVNSFSCLSSVKPFTVRKSNPSFANVQVPTTVLRNGENTIYAFNVTANVAGSVSFGRIVFEGMKTDANNSLKITNFNLYRGSALLTNVNINSSTAGKVIVAFLQEETISAGSSNIYYLKANVSGAGTGDSITSRIAIGDENVAVAGLNVNNGNQNTGKVFDAGGANLALITSAVNGFSSAVGTARNIIWSDNSADMHQYPIIASGNVTNATGSYDWTNGYLLKANVLSAVTLSFSQ